MNWVDYLIIGVIAISTVVSILRGFVREALSLASWVLAFFVAFWYSDNLANHLTEISRPTLRFAIGFFILFVATLLVMMFVNMLISRLVEKTGLSGTDRLLGLCFGLARGVLVVSIAIMLGLFTPLTKDPLWQTSVIIPYLQPVGAWLKTQLTTHADRYFEKHFQSDQLTLDNEKRTERASDVVSDENPSNRSDEDSPNETRETP